MKDHKFSSPLASPIELQYALKDSHLPKEKNIALQELAGKIHRQKWINRFGFRKRGTLALFSGSDVAGKTLAASWLARKLDVPLYRIDLASVVSKYIGETEKNLAALLAKAETSDVILFFDEADALFGKRTDVKNNKDRYANQPVNYILQKIEHYRGIIIISTNSAHDIGLPLKKLFEIVLDFPEE